MADNLPAHSDATKILAADNIAGVLYPRSKLVIGADGTNDGDVSAANPLPTKTHGPASGAVSSVSASASAITILAANSSRRGALVFNDSTATLYLYLSGTGTVTSSLFSVKLAAGEAFALGEGEYTGIITGIWSSATGAARVTEMT